MRAHLLHADTAHQVGGTSQKVLFHPSSSDMLQQHAGVVIEGIKSPISRFFLACGPSKPVRLALEHVHRGLFHQHNRSSIEPQVDGHDSP